MIFTDQTRALLQQWRSGAPRYVVLYQIYTIRRVLWWKEQGIDVQ